MLQANQDLQNQSQQSSGHKRSQTGITLSHQKQSPQKTISSLNNQLFSNQSQVQSFNITNSTHIFKPITFATPPSHIKTESHIVCLPFEKSGVEMQSQQRVPQDTNIQTGPQVEIKPQQIQLKQIVYKQCQPVEKLVQYIPQNSSNHFILNLQPIKTNNNIVLYPPTIIPGPIIYSQAVQKNICPLHKQSFDETSQTKQHIQVINTRPLYKKIQSKVPVKIANKLQLSPTKSTFNRESKIQDAEKLVENTDNFII